MDSPTTHAVDVDGVQQRYHVAGTGPVCVVHSGGPGIVWKYLRMPALEQHFTTVYIEPVGTGKSGRLADPAEYNLDTYVRFLHAVVADLGVPQVSLLGHSHGGFVIQRYALAYPDRVAGLVLYDTSPVTGPEFWGDAAANVQRFAESHADKPDAAGIAAAFDAPHDQLDDKGVTEVIRTLLPAYFADYWADDYQSFHDGIEVWQAPMRGVEPTPFDVREQLQSATTPALIVFGVHDFICGPRWAEMLRKALPHAQVLELAGSGHFGHIEQPELFFPAVVEFLS
jgi:proline iminopeptidase